MRILKLLVATACAALTFAVGASVASADPGNGKGATILRGDTTTNTSLCLLGVSEALGVDLTVTSCQVVVTPSGVVSVTGTFSFPEGSLPTATTTTSGWDCTVRTSTDAGAEGTVTTRSHLVARTDGTVTAHCLLKP